MSGVILALLNVSVPYATSVTLIIFILASITDYLDGHLARNVYGTTSFGKLMDPLADKIMVTVCFICFVEIHLPYYASKPLMPAWMVVLIISREFMVTGLRLLGAGKGKLISAGKWGKHKTIWQIVMISVLLLGLAVRYDILGNASVTLLENYDFVFHWIAWGLGVAVSAITVISGAMYYAENTDLIRQHL